MTSLFRHEPVTVSFGEHYVASAAFDTIYAEGMALVEETANYLDSEGRKDAKGLSAQTAMLYATESMRLTTRLMQLASWLLIRRAVKDGEMTPDDAAQERRKVKLNAVSRPGHVKEFDTLPGRLRSLIDESHTLYERVAKLDRMIEEAGATPVGPSASPVGSQFARLEAAFSARGKPHAAAR